MPGVGGGREDYGIHNWNAGKSAAAEAGLTLQQPEVHHVFSCGSGARITGPWQWWAAQAPGGARYG